MYEFVKKNSPHSLAVMCALEIDMERFFRPTQPLIMINFYHNQPDLFISILCVGRPMVLQKLLYEQALLPMFIS